MPDPTIRRKLPCARCGYDLEGLAAHARCPECGHEVMETLAAQLDPATEALARSPKLTRTAWSIFLVSLGSVLGCAVALAPAIGALEDAIGFPRWSLPGMHGARAIAPTVAAFGCGLGLFAAMFVLPWDRTRPVLRARVLGTAGFALWGAVSLRDPSWEASLASLIGVALVAGSVTPLLRQLVPHSRLFRTARHATQTTRELLIASAVAGGAGVAALVFAASPEELDTPATIAGAVAGTAAMLVCVGLAYRLVNSYWVLRSVRRPPPRIDDLLGP